MDTIKIEESVAAHKDWSALDVLLGERIRHRRRAQKTSLKQLAESSGISIGLLSQIERGLSSPSLRVLASLADALKLGLADLVRRRAGGARREGTDRRARRRAQEAQASGVQAFPRSF